MIHRDYAIERDDKGLPTQMVWRGDYDVPERKSRAEIEAEKLKEYEKVYGKREATS